MEPRREIGREIRLKRIDLDWSEWDLASKINEVIRDERKQYTRQDVQAWEMLDRLPDEREINALVEVLIRQNDRVTDKEGAERKFMEIYHETSRAFDTGTLNIKQSNIGRMIRELRGEKSEADLAREVSAIVPSLHPKVTKDNVADLEDGILYDRQLFGAALKVYVTEGKLPEGEVEQLQKRYAQLKKPSDARNALISSEPPRNLYGAHKRLVDYLGDDAKEFMKNSVELPKYIDISDRKRAYNAIIGEVSRRQEEFDVVRVVDFLQELERHKDSYLKLEKEMKTVRETIPALSEYSPILDNIAHIPVSLSRDGDNNTLDPEKLRKELNDNIKERGGKPTEETDRAVDKIIALKQQLLDAVSPAGPAPAQHR